MQYSGLNCFANFRPSDFSCLTVLILSPPTVQKTDSRDWEDQVVFKSVEKAAVNLVTCEAFTGVFMRHNMRA